MQTALARVTVPLAVSLVPAFAYSAEAPARPVDSGAIFTAVLENDIFADTDSNYTNGVRFAWMSAENEEPSWVDWLADRIPFYVPETRRISIAVGQSMFTPEDITLNPPLARDRPYGG